MYRSSSTRSSKSPRKLSFHLPRILVDLANMQEGDDVRFRKRWNVYESYSDKKLLGLRDELRLLWPGYVSEEVMSRPMSADNSARVEDLDPLVRNWLEHRPRDMSLEEFICEQWLHRAVRNNGLLVDWSSKRLTPDQTSLPVVLLWGCLQNGDRLAYCQNPECPAPYFIRTRKQQKFCTEACAAPAKREAKRKWWNANRAGKTKDKTMLG